MKSLILIIFGFVFLQNKSSAQNNIIYDTQVSNARFADPDEQGYRYCAHWKLADGTTLYSSCDPFAFKRCGKTLEFGYDCCVGFQKQGPPFFENNLSGNEACAKTIPQWKSCPDVLSLFPGSLGFSRMIKTGDMTDENSNQDFTIFAPDQVNSNELSKIYSSSSPRRNDPIFYHVVKGRFYASNLRNNQELISVFQNQKLKVTKYSFGVICIDCVELTKADLECKNGVIHFIRKPLVPRVGTSFDRNNLLVALQSDPETSSFANDIPSNLQQELQNTKSKIWYTVLAVKNENWRTIKNKYSGMELEKIVRNHIIPKLYCSAALYKSVREITTASGERISVECTTENSAEMRYVSDLCGGKSKFVSQDNMAANGVYHIIEKPLIPLSAMSFNDILNNPKCASSNFFKANKFFDFIKGCDLRMQPGKKYSILMPIDKSFEWWKGYGQFQPEYSRFLKDKEYRCRVARYHIVEQNPELEKLSSLMHEQKGYKTNNRDLLHEVDYFLKDRDHSDLYFHFSPVVDFKSDKFRDGSLYRISRINVIPEKFIVDILKENPNLKTTSNQVQKADMDKTEFKPKRPLSLFLATLDEGLKDLKTGKIDKIIAGYDGKSLKNYLLLHTVPLYLWGGDIGYFKPNTVHRFMSRSGIELIFWMDKNQVMRIGYDGLPKEKWAEVVKFNLHAKDGIVWLLKRNLPCPIKLCPHKIVIIDYDLYDVYVSACQIMELPGIKDAKDAKVQFNARPIKIALDNPTKCSIYKQPTHKVTKKISP